MFYEYKDAAELKFFSAAIYFKENKAMEDEEKKDLQNPEEPSVEGEKTDGEGQEGEKTDGEGQEGEGKGSDYAEAIEALRAEFQAKFDKQEADNKARLAERDGIIKQLLTGEGKTATPPEDKIVAKINSKRNYKKW